MKKNLLRIIVVVFILLFIFIALFFLIPNSCENEFKTYPEKGYCEFNLENCEGLFGCKEYNNVQVPCESVSTLCGEKVLCDCGNSFNNKTRELENNANINNLPNSFKADYILFQNYISRVFKIEDYHMPGLSVINGEIDCKETGPNPSLGTLTTKIITREKEINDKKYCVMYSIAGAAESISTQNSYTTVIDDRVYLVNFGAHYNNCGDYLEEGVFECVTERKNFNLDLLVDQEIEKLINKKLKDL